MGGRGERIRTSGLYVPNVALYQAKLHPEFDIPQGPMRMKWLIVYGPIMTLLVSDPDPANVSLIVSNRS